MWLNRVGLPELYCSSHKRGMTLREIYSLLMIGQGLAAAKQISLLQKRCPMFQVINASWEATRGALVKMVLEMGP